jgi:NADH pyrophosphatase NudC (nudix superfamily)
MHELVGLGSLSVVHGYVDSGEQRVAGDEVDEVRWVKVTAIGRLISDGTLQDGITLGALAVWRLAATLPSA